MFQKIEIVQFYSPFCDLHIRKDFYGFKFVTAKKRGKEKYTFEHQKKLYHKTLFSDDMLDLERNSQYEKKNLFEVFYKHVQKLPRAKNVVSWSALIHLYSRDGK